MTKARNLPTLKSEPHPAEERSEYSKALDALTRYLAMRDHSRVELRAKLLRRFPENLIDTLLVEADEKGWLIPEDQVAERLALTLSKRHKSQMHIEGELRKRGLPLPSGEAEREIVNNEAESIRHLVERKFGTNLSAEQKAKAYRFLTYRGFKDSSIEQVLNEK